MYFVFRPVVDISVSRVKFVNNVNRRDLTVVGNYCKIFMGYFSVSEVRTGVFTNNFMGQFKSVKFWVYDISFLWDGRGILLNTL